MNTFSQDALDGKPFCAGRYVAHLPDPFKDLQTYGGTNLQQFGFDDGAERRLLSMIVYAGPWINGILIQYRDLSTVCHGTCTNSTGEPGERAYPIDIGYLEYITSVEGKFGEMNTEERFGPPYCDSGSTYQWQYIMGQMKFTTNYGRIFPDQQRDGISVYGYDTGTKCPGVAGLNTDFKLVADATGGFIGATSYHSGDRPGITTLSALGWYTRV